jgi:iron(III) transport system ATP-binding protein
MHDLRFVSISKQFSDGTRALRNVTFEAPGGRLTSLLGPSGSGKSTLLRIAAGLESASSGSLLVGPQNLAGIPAEHRPITMLFQNGTLFPHMTVGENVAFGLRNAQVSRHSSLARARSTLAMVGAEALLDRACHELSGGEQQRVQLARALAFEPQVILLDEPLSNLDWRTRRLLRTEISALQRRLRLTMVYVTHDATEAMSISDWVVFLSEGQLVQQGSPRDVYERPDNEFVAEFMGDGSIFDTVADATGTVVLAGLRLSQLGPQVPCARVRLLVRPQAWGLHAAGHKPGLAGRIDRASYLGNAIENAVITDLGTLIILTHDTANRHQKGAPVTVVLEHPGASVLSISE